MAAQKSQNNTGRLNKRLVITSLIAGVLFAIVNSAIWVNQQIFDTEKFTNTAVASITSEDSRQAIGARLVDEILKDRPVAKNIIGDQATNLMSGLLGTDQAEKLLTAAVTKLQIYVTSSNQQDVDIDFTGLKDIIARIASISGTEQTSRLNPDNIPDKIVLVQAENVPDLYMYGVILSWIAPIGFLAALALLAWPYFADRKNYLTNMTVHGVLLIATGLISLLIGPLFRPSVLEPFQNVNGRAVVGNLYDAFISTFNSQTVFLIYLGISICVAALIIKLVPHAKKLMKK